MSKENTVEPNNEKKVKILIIEDEQSLVDLLTTKLKKENYNVIFAYDGEEGYKLIGEWKPDLILLDIVMPKMDGYAVLEKMNEEGLKIPVIIISNSGQPVEIEKTKRLGAVDHLIKTEFNPIDVINKIKNFLDYKDSGGVKTNGQTIIAKESDSVQKLNIKVLLVEDDAFLREICSKKLVKEGFTVYEAIDGEQALNGVEQIEPDIILLDIILPAIDGFQILHQIKNGKNKKVSTTPVIMLSNLGQDDDIKKAMEMGANDYLVKAHFTTEEIVAKIKKTLGK
jgi:DNA-binding response OmpR family regulator